VIVGISERLSQLRDFGGAHELVLRFTHSVAVHQHVDRESVSMLDSPVNQALLHHVSQIGDELLFAGCRRIEPG